MDLQKNDDIEATIESLGYRGEGVARIDRVPVFVNGALPGERVRAHLILVKKDYAVGKLTEILSRSPDRAEPKCKYFGKCGGCNLQHLSYPAQLAFKRVAVKDALRKIAHIDHEVSACVPCGSEYGYRNKLSLPVRQGRNGVEAGLFAYNSHRIVEIDDCPLQTNRVRALIPGLRTLAGAFKPYDEETGKGELRHFVVRDLGGRLSLTAVAVYDVADKLCRAVREAGIETDELWLNINRANNNVIMGDKTILVAGEPGVCDVMGLPVTVHPKGFMQVNADITAKLYSALREKAVSVSPDIIVDAYSGGGTLTALLAPYAVKATGIEIERAAVGSADELMRRAGIDNVSNVCGDCAEELPKLLREVTGESLVLLDPPRSGCDRSVVEAVNACGASTLLYVSCNPSTLARDLALLSHYEPVSITPFDMFPQTCHVETLIMLERKI